MDPTPHCLPPQAQPPPPQDISHRRAAAGPPPCNQLSGSVLKGHPVVRPGTPLPFTSHVASWWLLAHLTEHFPLPPSPRDPGAHASLLSSGCSDRLMSSPRPLNADVPSSSTSLAQPPRPKLLLWGPAWSLLSHTTSTQTTAQVSRLPRLSSGHQATFPKAHVTQRYLGLLTSKVMLMTLPADLPPACPSSGMGPASHHP